MQSLNAYSFKIYTVNLTFLDNVYSEMIFYLFFMLRKHEHVTYRLKYLEKKQLIRYWLVGSPDGRGVLTDRHRRKKKVANTRKNIKYFKIVFKLNKMPC